MKIYFAIYKRQIHIHCVKKNLFNTTSFYTNEAAKTRDNLLTGGTQGFPFNFLPNFC